MHTWALGDDVDLADLPLTALIDRVETGVLDLLGTNAATELGRNGKLEPNTLGLEPFLYMRSRRIVVLGLRLASRLVRHEQAA
jgi:hypothetical protein